MHLAERNQWKKYENEDEINCFHKRNAITKNNTNFYSFVRMAEAVFKKYNVASQDELLETIEERLFEEVKRWKERLHIRPLRDKHLKQMQEFSSDFSFIFGNSAIPVTELIWEKQTDWLTQLRHLELTIAKGLTQVFQAVSPNVVVQYALHLSHYLEKFEDELLSQESHFLTYTSEVNSRDLLDTARCIQFLVENKEEQAMELLGKEVKRLRTIVK
jgi:hypothetical protein